MEKQTTADWKTIGYTAPGTSPAAGSGTSSYTNVIAYAGATGDGTATWTATPKGDLNDCSTNMKWELVGTASGTNVGYTNSTTSANCKALTPSWDNLTRGTN